MNSSDHTDFAKLDELLAGRALGDLTDAERDDLDSLLLKFPDRDADEIDLVASAVASLATTSEKMPDRLRQAVADDAVQRSVLQESREPVLKSRFEFREMFAWTVAAACLMLALLQMKTPGRPVSSMVSQRDALLKTADDLIEVEWQAGLHPFAAEVTGNVVWSNDGQRGFLRFSNMPVNDPSVEQYQLWIIDPDRDDEPIDGGVFDITKSGDVIIPIHAKLDVVNPQAFAITIEKPGGVVVSTQERLPLLAKVGA